jgi:tetratricopeptide (TPR) repeat protein
MELRHRYGLSGSHRSYAVALAVLGHFLVRSQGRGIMIAELSGGFFVSWHDPIDWGKAASHIVEHDHILDQVGPVQGGLLTSDQLRKPPKKGLFRKQETQYDMTRADFLHALGQRLDRQRAVSITVIETLTGFRFSYWVDKATFVIQGAFRLPISLRHDETLEGSEVQALIASEQGRRQKELDAIEHSLRAGPRDFPNLIAAIANLEESLRFREAEELAVQVATVVPEREEGHYHAARFALMRGDRPAAAERLRRAPQSTMPELLDFQARLFWADGKRIEALALWEKAVQVEPPIPVHLQRYGRALGEVGRADEAITHLQEAEVSTVAPTRDMAVDLLDAEAKIRQEEQEAFLRRRPDNALPGRRIVTPENTASNPATAERDRPRGALRARVEADLPDWAFVDNVEEPAEEEPQDEIGRLMAQLSRSPEDTALLRKLGFAFARAGQLDASAEAYRRAIDLDSRR